jgi:hypothetical protein
VDRFYWQNRQGVYTTAQVFSLVQSISCEGLSRVYTISVSTVDTTLYELTALVPVLVEDSASAIAQSIASAALDSDQFMRPNGITMMDARTTGFDPSSADGAGGAWLFWQTVLGRQLLRLGYGKQIVTATKKMLDMQVQILKATHEFAQFYHSDEPRGLGEPGHLHGIAPLDLLHDIWGIRILNPATVALSKDFFWNRSVTIQQHGILVRRSGSTVKIVFASGHKVELKSLDQNMLIQDPSPAPRRTYLPIAHPALPEPESPAASARSVRIPVEVEE